MKAISVVVPIYNEEETLYELYTRLTASLELSFSDMDQQIVFIDDGSTDRSQEILKKYAEHDNRITIICFSRNFGHQIAISAGLDHAIGDYVVMMDGDLQDRPEDIVHLYNKLKEGYDVVYSERLEKKFSWFKRLTAYCFIKILRFLVSDRIVINNHVFRIMKKKVVQAVVSLRENQRFIVGLIGWVGFKHTGLPLKHAERKYGETKYGIFAQIKLATNALCSFSTYPLKLITHLGFFIMAISFSLGLFIVVRHFVYGGHVHGWSSLIVSILCMGGVQLFSLGIIGEYIGRSYIEQKQRPLYVLSEVVNNKKIVSELKMYASSKMQVHHVN